MVRRMPFLAAGIVCALVAIGVAVRGWAHETREIAGQFRLIVGLRVEPAYTDVLNGLDLIVRRASDGAPVEGLEKTLNAELIGPDGTSRRRLQLRPVHGQPGRYTDDFVLTRPGEYRIRIWGAIGDVQVDETFHTHEVKPLASVRFP